MLYVYIWFYVFYVLSIEPFRSNRTTCHSSHVYSWIPSTGRDLCYDDHVLWPHFQHIKPHVCRVSLMSSLLARQSPFRLVNSLCHTLSLLSKPPSRHQARTTAHLVREAHAGGRGRTNRVFPPTCTAAYAAWQETSSNLRFLRKGSLTFFSRLADSGVLLSNVKTQ